MRRPSHSVATGELLQVVGEETVAPTAIAGRDCQRMEDVMGAREKGT